MEKLDLIKSGIGMAIDSRLDGILSRRNLNGFEKLNCGICSVDDELDFSTLANVDELVLLLMDDLFNTGEDFFELSSSSSTC